MVGTTFAGWESRGPQDRADDTMRELRRLDRRLAKKYGPAPELEPWPEDIGVPSPRSNMALPQRVALVLPWFRMTSIPQKTLRNQVGEILRRAEAGERFTVTVAGRATAELGPIRSRHWVAGPELQRVWATPAPRTLADDLERIDATLADPFAQ